MSYVNMDHAGWVERHTKQTLSPFARKVADILGIVGGGIHNAPVNVNEIDWQSPKGMGIKVTWNREMSTWDFCQLSQMVVLCCQARVRCQINAVAPRRLSLIFHQRRDAPAEEFSRHHPGIDEMVERLRVPDDHPIVRDAK